MKWKRALVLLSALVLVMSTLLSSLTVLAQTYTPPSVTWITQNQMSIQSYYGQQSTTLGVAKILDGDKNSKWETPWSGIPSLPVVALVLDLGSVWQDVCQIKYTPRQSEENGKINIFSFRAGTTLDNMKTVAGGNWDYSGNRGDASDRTATFPSMEARYVELTVYSVARNGSSDGNHITCAELNVGTAAGVTVETNELDSLLITAEDRLASMPESYDKVLLTKAVESTRNLQAQVGIFSAEQISLSADALRTALRTEGRVEVSVKYAPVAASKNPISYMVDNNKATFYETQWSGGLTYFPGAYIVLDLGGVIGNVSQLLYSPRQSEKDFNNGRVLQYNIYTSTEDLSQITLTGTAQELESHFTFAGKGEWPLDGFEDRTATFSSRPARYVLLQAMTTGGDGNTITCAEIGVARGDFAAVDHTALDEALVKGDQFLQTTELPTAKRTVGELVSAIRRDYGLYTQEGSLAAAAGLLELLTIAQGTKTSIQNGPVWYDTDLTPIQAHGGGILYNEANQTYYWYGEDKTESNLAGTTCVPITGVHCYSSKDLYNWKNEGVALPVFNNPQFVDGTPASDDLPLYVSESSDAYRNSPLQSYADYVTESGNSRPNNGTTKAPSDTLDLHNDSQRIEELNTLYDGYTYQQKKDMYLDFNWNKVVERPKVVYNEATGKYIMWWHHDGPKAGEYSVASGGVAIADSPAGPFQYLNVSRLPNDGYSGSNQGMLRDMTLYVDEDQTCYLIYSSEDNKTTIMLKLDETYTKPATNELGQCLQGVHWTRAHSDNREAPAVFRQDGVYYMITSGLTGWNPNPAKYHVSETGLMGTWVDKGDPCIDDVGKNTFKSQSTFALPYRDAQGKVVPGKFIFMADRWNPNNLKDSRYIWLPIELDSENKSLSIHYTDEWKFEEVFAGNLQLQIENLPLTLTAGEELDLSSVTAWLVDDLLGLKTAVDLSDIVVSDFDNTTPGVKEVTFTYTGEQGTFQVTLEITVVEKGTEEPQLQITAPESVYLDEYFEIELQSEFDPSDLLLVNEKGSRIGHSVQSVTEEEGRYTAVLRLKVGTVGIDRTVTVVDGEGKEFGSFVFDCTRRKLEKADILVPETVTVEEFFEVTLTSTIPLGKFNLLNENDSKVGYTILSVEEGERVTTVIRLNVGTTGQQRELRLVDSKGTELGSFTFDCVKAVLPTRISRVEAPERAAAGETFTVTVTTSKDLVKIKFTTDAGKTIGATRVSKTVSGNDVTYVYELSVGTPGQNRGFCVYADVDKSSAWPYSMPFGMTIA